ncbi:Oligopeptidase B [Cellulophaga algicola DSM 14237]|uniref:Proline-specific endopeptidase n=1 Tax=Cellulophaga algicola (strain DSM 14237 / IC166 / ACAM 630) TaxID=688270 RepID=E6X7J2_CELAD|nr:oligopeptidase B [Cellulophaga algicola]ADV50702.1 Oligopeptidase B [Cellulophaga algicola DSM 14237]
MRCTLKKAFIFLLSISFAASCKSDKKIMSQNTVPVAKKMPKSLEIHGDTRIDNYYWLNDREDKEVIDYLNEEKAYYEKMMAHTVSFQNSLFDEMKSRIKEDDSSVPYKQNGYWYSTRYEIGKEYPIYSRKTDTNNAEAIELFDCNVMAEGLDYFKLGGIAVSPNNELAVFGVDDVSRREYTLKIKNLNTGEIYDDVIEKTTGGAVWANDNKTFFYSKKDPITLRSDKIYKHVLGTPTVDDVMVYHEEDETYDCFVYKTKSKKYIIIGSTSTLTSEYRYIKSDAPNSDFTIFSKRERGVEYSLAHYKDDFYILTNKDDATNFKLMKTSDTKTSSENWEDFIAHRSDVLLEDIEIFKEFYVISERENGLAKIKIVRWDSEESYFLPFNDETYTAYVSTNPDFDTEILRYGYNSLTTPSSVIDFNMKTKEKDVKKEQEVLGGKFQKENYTSERIWATARDGVKIPMSVVYHKDTKLDGSSPLLQYGYGSYGYTLDPNFSTVRLSLLDRGFIYVIAHVRGSEYLGRQWYDEGKLLKKQNSFTDFIDCSKFLIANQYTSPEHLYAEGGSAGGLLMGGIVNMEPNLYHGVIAAVPFVDVVTTMLDDTIPLTTGEYDEWGNPNEKEYYDYMKSYSPYDNVQEIKYPNMLITTGLHDSQVQYWEPAKWVAKLRDMKKDTNVLLFDINMDAGHGGASGRFEALKEVAKEYAFLIDLEKKID